MFDHEEAQGRRFGPPRGPWREGTFPPNWSPPNWSDRPRVRRGSTRSALLVALLDGPAHGYELIRRLEERSAGRWRPSPGSVYPTLQMLEDADLVSSTEEDGKRIFVLTEKGAAHAEEARAQQGAPWSASTGPDLRAALAEVAVAARQVAMVGGQRELEAAGELLAATRRSLYRLLADDQ